jgi:1-acyl-sn-glycerol-3-phosphate acyltransferase
MSQHSQFALMKSKNFLPLFITQFLGAFNDNIFKNSLVILLAFSASILPSGITPELAVNISAAIFILPFLLFSAVAGQLADFNEKSRIIRYLKIVELGVICIASASLIMQNVYLMWTALFGLGVQAAFFGPIKYSILPQHLKENELVGGNALIESGTFIAILTGTILGGVLIGINNGATYIVSLLLICSVVGVLSAWKIPVAQNIQSGNISFNIFKQSVDIIKIAKSQKSVFLSILGISWFWFLGATLLSQFPLLVKNVIGANAQVVTVLLTLFSVGIAIGSLLCEKLSQGKVEIGLVPFGAIGLTVFGFDLYFALEAFKALGGDAGASAFIHAPNSYRIMLDLFFMGIFGGFFTVPLYAFIQSRSLPENRSRIIGANNILNSLFMIASAVFAVVCFQLGLTVNQLILATVGLNLLISIYIFALVPEFLMRFIVWILTHTMYRVKKEGLANIPDEGAALLIANHISFMDALIIFGATQRPVKFVMAHKIFNIPFFNYMFKAGGAIPIASKKENEQVFNEAFVKISQYLNDGEIVVIFPEGTITKDGNIGEFKPGILKVLATNPVPVIPAALSGLWGSMYSRKENSVWRYIPKSFFGRQVYYRVGESIPADKVNIKDLETKVKALRGEVK